LKVALSLPGLTTMRIDSHQHFWRYNPLQHVWMTDQMDVLRRDYLPPDLASQLASIGFDGCIAVQSRQLIEETDWLLELAEANHIIRGVVGWVDLRSQRLVEQLERYADRSHLVGVRHVVHDEPDDDFMLLPEFRRGIAQLGKFDLTYDLLLFPRHLPVAVKLVSEFLEQPFVLDHIAKPVIRDRQLSPWRENLRQLGQFENVCCKLSGMVTEAVWKQWRADDFRSYLDIVIEAFGTDRVMIGSDWPVCTLSGDYAATMQVVIDYCQQFSAEIRESVLGGNCARFYGIGQTSDKR
jgi:L-fuconolactonase